MGGGNEVSMNVAWLTARYFGKDLCATTQIELSTLGLVRCGVNLTVYSPCKFPASEVQIYLNSKKQNKRKTIRYLL